MLSHATNYGLLKILAENPTLSQRGLAKQLGLSLGKVNFCLNALIRKGCIKVNNFRSSDNKRAYSYLLTPEGMEEKARVTVEFLQFKVAEYERLRMEIAVLEYEAHNQQGAVQ
ncbi:MAG: MarR family EPS-associated transcriptional regulator [Gallionella sp.]|nr:MarR family EPS-associated transcriptional regulator [Gallionella sp.]MDD4957790.1 MarR family EPS-associated transcriptional regulator [Gallionella sp.]